MPVVGCSASGLAIFRPISNFCSQLDVGEILGLAHNPRDSRCARAPEKNTPTSFYDLTFANLAQGCAKNFTSPATSQGEPPSEYYFLHISRGFDRREGSNSCSSVCLPAPTPRPRVSPAVPSSRLVCQYSPANEHELDLCLRRL